MVLKKYNMNVKPSYLQCLVLKYLEKKVEQYEVKLHGKLFKSRVLQARVRGGLLAGQGQESSKT